MCTRACLPATLLYWPVLLQRIFPFLDHGNIKCAGGPCLQGFLFLLKITESEEAEQTVCLSRGPHCQSKVRES